MEGIVQVVRVLFILEEIYQISLLCRAISVGVSPGDEIRVLIVKRHFGIPDYKLPLSHPTVEAIAISLIDTAST